MTQQDHPLNGTLLYTVRTFLFFFQSSDSLTCSKGKAMILWMENRLEKLKFHAQGNDGTNPSIGNVSHLYIRIAAF